MLPACTQVAEREVSVSRSLTSFDRRSLDTSGLRDFVKKHGGQAPHAGTWNFESLALAAYYLHPSLDVARAELDSARAAEITAGAKPNPSVGISPSFNTSSKGVSPWIAAINFDIPIETAGKRTLKLIEARHRTEAAGFRLVDAGWQVRTNLRKALLDLADSTARMRFVDRQITAQQASLNALQQKVAAGAMSNAELSTTRSALLRMTKDREDVAGQAAEARARVATALGLPSHALPADLSANADVSNAEALGTREARKRALTSRSDLLAALADYAAAEAALKLEVARQYPDIHLGPGYEFDQGENKWSLGFNVELPVFNQNQGPIAESEAKRKEAAARLLALQASIAGEVEQAVAKWQGSKRRRAVLDGLVREQQQAVKAAEAGVSSGAGERTDQLAAEAELASAELLRWDGTVEEAKALAELEAATQHPLAFDFTISPRPEEP